MSFFVSDVTIGWERPLYTASEADGFVEICAIVQRGPSSIGTNLPLINILTSDVTATSKFVKGRSLTEEFHVI